MTEIDLEAIELRKGAHATPEEGVCVMEMVALLAGEPHSDHPECACPLIGAFLRLWNDALPDADRSRLLRNLVPRVIGTRSAEEVERRRSWMALDWLTRTCIPAWLRLAGSTERADALAALPELTAPNDEALTQLHITRDTIWCAVNHDAFQGVVWSLSGESAGEAASRITRRTDWLDARAFANATFNLATRAAIKAVSGDASKAEPTVRELQQSARELVLRMCDVTAAGEGLEPPTTELTARRSTS